MLIQNLIPQGCPGNFRPFLLIAQTLRDWNAFAILRDIRIIAHVFGLQNITILVPTFDKHCKNCWVIMWLRVSD